MKGVRKIFAALKRSIKRIAKMLGMGHALRQMWEFVKIWGFEAVKVALDNPPGQCRRIYLFGRKIWQSGGRKRSQPSDPNRRVFYFKINQQASYTLMCIQHWLNIAAEMDADFYFICDNRRLERQIVRNLHFRDSDIKFIPSDRFKLRRIAKCLWTGPWEMATYAHLTAFYHARSLGIKQSWMIDADDTMFFLYAEQTAKILRNVENVANHDKISAISLDMHWSQMYGKHWSLGVVYVNNIMDFCEIFQTVQSLDWIKPYQEIDDVFNLDWFFNYLKDTNKKKIETFYVENCYFFFFFPDFMRTLIGRALCFWQNGKIVYPLIKDIYRNEGLGVIPTNGCYKISIDITLNDGLKFMENEISMLFHLSPKQRKVFRANDFGEYSRYRFP